MMRSLVLCGLSVALALDTAAAFHAPLQTLPSVLAGHSISASTRVGLRAPLGVSMMAKAKKGKKGGKKGGGGDDDSDAPVKIKMDTDVKGVDIASIQSSVDEKMDKTIENTKASLGSIRTGRPSPNLLDRVLVDYYGTDTPVPQVASVTIASGTTIVVEPFEKDLLKEVEKAIATSDLDMTPNNDGTVIRLNVPPLTTETRAKYVKQAKAAAEDGKVAARNIRRGGVDAIKKLEKDSKIGEDESKDAQDKVQKSTDKAVKEIETLCDAKEKELAKV